MKKTLAYLAAALSCALSAADAPRQESFTGTVIFSRPFTFFILRNGDKVVNVASSQGWPALKPGDVATATGTPAMRDGRPSLEVSTYERLSEGARLPEPVAMSVAEIEHRLKEPDVDAAYGLRVRVRGRLKSFEKMNWGETELHLESTGIPVVARYHGDIPKSTLDDLELHPILEATGVLLFEQTPGNPVPYAWIRAQELSDVAIVKDAAFTRKTMLRTTRRLLVHLPILLVPIVAWLLAKLYRSRAQRRRLEAVIAERKRMAADLHDTIEQHLAGARLYLESMLPEDGSPAPTSLRPVELAREILIQAKREIRETVWNLRTEELLDKNPADVLKSLAERMSAPGAFRVETILRGLPNHLPERIFSDILYIIQESITNAVKHGGASRIVIAADSDNAGLQFAVLNNGKPFDVNSALGPEAGHFGLSGMRERARRGGFSVSFKSSRKITSVRIWKEKP